MPTSELPVGLPPRVFFEENEDDDGPDMSSARLRGTDYTSFEYLSIQEHTVLIEAAKRDAYAEILSLVESSDGDIDFAIFRIKERMRPEYLESEKRLLKTIADQLVRAKASGTERKEE